jgi:hypothetical protein
MHDKAWRIGGRLVYLALHHRSAGVNCGSPRTSDDATFPTHASRPPILRGRRSVARGSTSPRPNSARLNRTQQQRESECRQKLLHWGCLAIISSHQACGGRHSSAPSPPCKDGRTLSSLRSISNCKPAACVSGVRMMRRIRFDPTATQFAGRSGLVTGMEPLSTYATSSIFSEPGVNMRDLFAEDVRASFRRANKFASIERRAKKRCGRPLRTKDGREGLVGRRQ